MENFAHQSTPSTLQPLQSEAISENTIHIVAFYRFVTLSDFEALRDPMKAHFESLGIRGSILLAKEGINGTIGGTSEAIEGFFAYLNQDARLANIEYKVSYTSEIPFRKMKVRLKQEIVRLAVDNLDMSQRGEYVRGEAWDALIADPDVVVVDTRNFYEVEMGTFKHALNPNTRDFRHFPDWAKQHLDPKKHKKLAMFCTGGIRCEKSTAYMKSQGFEEVYHLEGGILQYLEDTGNKNKMWQGDCFVFDDRIGVDEHLQPIDPARCERCGAVLKPPYPCVAC